MMFNIYKHHTRRKMKNYQKPIIVKNEEIYSEIVNACSGEKTHTWEPPKKKAKCRKCIDKYHANALCVGCPYYNPHCWFNLFDDECLANDR